MPQHLNATTYLEISRAESESIITTNDVTKDKTEISNDNLCSIFFSQAKVALNLQPKQSEPEPEEDEALTREKIARKSSDTLHSSVVETLKEEKACDVVPSTSHVMDITDPPSTSLSIQKSEETVQMIDKSNVKTHSQDATEAKSEPMVEDEPEEEIGEIHIVGYKC